MDISLDFETSLNRTTASTLDISQEKSSDEQNNTQVDSLAKTIKEQCEDSSKETSEQDDVPDSLESDGEIEDDTTEEKEEVAKEKEEDKMEVPEKEAAIENDVPEGDVPVAPAPEDDTVELTSNQFENELFGEEEKAAQVKEAVVVEELPKPAPKKAAAPPPKIHNRHYKMPELEPEKPTIQWENKLVRNLISTDLLKELIDIKLTKEEDNTDARSRRSRHFRTNSGETKKKAVKKDDEDLDFEPESDHEAEMDQVDENKDVSKEPTAFPDPPAEPAPRSRKEENRALLITNLIRPFTVLQLKTMLSHCGKVKSIWISTVKSRCYVVFATLEEAGRARESLHGAVWPSTSPKKLIVDFAEDERMYSETDGELIGDSIDIQVIEEQKRKKPKKDKEQTEEKGTMLDDLFKKTVSVPSIYWLPLTEKQAKTRTEEKSKTKPRYFIPEPELETEFVKPRAVPRWKTPDRTAAKSPARGKSPARARSPARRSPRRVDRRRR